MEWSPRLATRWEGQGRRGCTTYFCYEVQQIQVCRIEGFVFRCLFNSFDFDFIENCSKRGSLLIVCVSLCARNILIKLIKLMLLLAVSAHDSYNINQNPNNKFNSNKKFNQTCFLNKHAQACECTYRICVVCCHKCVACHRIFQIALSNSMENVSRRSQKCVQYANNAMYIRSITILNNDKNINQF